MAIVYYHTMPDEETQRLIAARGDTIEIIGQPSATPTGATSFLPQSQLQTDPRLVTNDPSVFHDPAFGRAQVEAAQAWFADTAYRNAMDQYQRAVADYQRNVRENPNAFQPGGQLANTPPPRFEDYLQLQQNLWNTSASTRPGEIASGPALDFSQARQAYGTPAPYYAPTQQQTNIVSPAGTAVAPGSQPASNKPNTNTNTNEFRERSARPSSGDWASAAFASTGIGDWRWDGSGVPNVNRSNYGFAPRQTITENANPNTGVPEGSTALQPGSSGYGAIPNRFDWTAPNPRRIDTATNPILQDPQQNQPVNNAVNIGGGGQRPQQTVMQRLVAALEASGYSALPYDHIAWYYQQITGRPAPSPESLGITDRNATLTPHQFSAAMTNGGYDFETGTPGGSTPGGSTPGGSTPGGSTPNNPGNNPNASSGSGTFPGNYQPYLGDEINRMAQEDRNQAISQGEALANDLTQFGNRRETEYQDFTNRLMQTFGSQLGYNDEERNLILPGDRLDRLQWTDQDTRDLQLQDSEYDLVANSGRDQTGEWIVNQRLREGSQGVEDALDAADVATRDALDRQESAMRPWIDDRMLRSDQNVRGDMGTTYYDTLGRIREATGSNDIRTRPDLAGNLEQQDRANAQNLDRILSAGDLQYDSTVRGNILADLTQGESAIRATMNPDAMRVRQGFGDELTRAVDVGGEAALGAIDRDALRYDRNVNARTSTTLTDSANRIRQATDTNRLSMDPNLPANVESALSSGAAGMRGTVDPNRLRASGDFMSRYDWTQEDTDRLADQAGRTVAQRTLADQEAFERAAAAEGNTSPMAIQAAKARTRLQGNIAAGDTMTNARIAARQHELDTIMGREQVRIGAEQGYSDRARDVETTVSGRQLASVYDTENMRQQAERARAQIQAGAESDIANRDIETALEQEGRRLAAEHAATQLETGQINTNTANRLSAMTTGEQMRVGAEQSATEIQAGQEQQILNRRTEAQQRMEEERVRAAQSAAQARASAAASASAQATGNVLSAEQLRVGAAQNAARLVADTEASASERFNEMRLAGEQQRLGAEQFITQSGLDTERYLGSSRLANEQQNAAQRVASRNSQAERGLAGAQFITSHEADTNRFLVTNRQQATLEGKNQRYNRGMGIYQAGAQAGQTVGNARLGELNQQRNALRDTAAQAGEASTVTNQQKVGAFSAQQGAQSAATSNAIRNYAVPGLGERIGGIIGGMLADGGVRGETAIVGEAGPELVVDIPRASRLPQYGLGALIGNVVNGVRAANRPPQEIGPGVTENYQTGEMMPDSGQMAPRRKNRLWEGLKAAVMNPAAQAQQSYTDMVGNDYRQPGGGAGGGKLGNIIAGLLHSRARPPNVMADGGIAPSPTPIARTIAPGVEYVNGAQVRRLGEHGPEAVVPLTPRPTAKVTPGDIPRLLRDYRQGKPIQRLADGKVVKEEEEEKGFDWFGLRTLKKAAGNNPKKKPEPFDPGNMDIVRESIRRQMDSQRSEGAKAAGAGVKPPPTAANKRKGARR